MLIIGFSSGGDCGMFLIKYAKYLIHDHSFNSLISAHVDWFQEKWQLIVLL